MPATLKVLASGQVAAAATNTTAYSPSASTSAKIATASLTNVGNIPITVSLALVPAGQSVDATRLLLTSFVIGGYDTVDQETALGFLKGAFLEAGAAIVLTSDAAAVLNFSFTGAVIS